MKSLFGEVGAILSRSSGAEGGQARAGPISRLRPQASTEKLFKKAFMQQAAPVDLPSRPLASPSPQRPGIAARRPPESFHSSRPTKCRPLAISIRARAGGNHEAVVGRCQGDIERKALRR